MDHARHRHAHIHKIPLGPVVGDGDYFIPFFETHLQEPVSKLMGNLMVLLRGIKDPFSLYFLRQGLISREKGDRSFQ